ncbi:Cna B-type domain-containing protein [Facklamia hominis]
MRKILKIMPLLLGSLLTTPVLVQASESPEEPASYIASNQVTEEEDQAAALPLPKSSLPASLPEVEAAQISELVDEEKIVVPEASEESAQELPDPVIDQASQNPMAGNSSSGGGSPPTEALDIQSKTSEADSSDLTTTPESIPASRQVTDASDPNEESLGQTPVEEAEAKTVEAIRDISNDVQWDGTAWDKSGKRSPYDSDNLSDEYTYPLNIKMVLPRSLKQGDYIDIKIMNGGNFIGKKGRAEDVLYQAEGMPTLSESIIEEGHILRFKVMADWQATSSTAPSFNLKRMTYLDNDLLEVGRSNSGGWDYRPYSNVSYSVPSVWLGNQHKVDPWMNWMDNYWFPYEYDEALLKKKMGQFTESNRPFIDNQIPQGTRHKESRFILDQGQQFLQHSFFHRGSDQVVFESSTAVDLSRIKVYVLDYQDWSDESVKATNHFDNRSYIYSKYLKRIELPKDLYSLEQRDGRIFLTFHRKLPEQSRLYYGITVDQADDAMVDELKFIYRGGYLREKGISRQGDTVIPATDDFFPGEFNYQQQRIVFKKQNQKPWQVDSSNSLYRSEQIQTDEQRFQEDNLDMQGLQPLRILESLLDKRREIEYLNKDDLLLLPDSFDQGKLPDQPTLDLEKAPIEDILKNTGNWLTQASDPSNNPFGPGPSDRQGGVIVDHEIYQNGQGQYVYRLDFKAKKTIHKGQFFMVQANPGWRFYKGDQVPNDIILRGDLIFKGLKHQENPLAPSPEPNPDPTCKIRDSLPSLEDDLFEYDTYRIKDVPLFRVSYTKEGYLVFVALRTIEVMDDRPFIIGPQDSPTDEVPEAIKDQWLANKKIADQFLDKQPFTFKLEKLLIKNGNGTSNPKVWTVFGDHTHMPQASWQGRVADLKGQMTVDHTGSNSVRLVEASIDQGVFNHRIEWQTPPTGFVFDKVDISNKLLKAAIDLNQPSTMWVSGQLPSQDTSYTVTLTWKKGDQMILTSTLTVTVKAPEMTQEQFSSDITYTAFKTMNLWKYTQLYSGNCGPEMPPYLPPNPGPYPDPGPMPYPGPGPMPYPGPGPMPPLAVPDVPLALRSREESLPMLARVGAQDGHDLEIAPFNSDNYLALRGSGSFSSGGGGSSGGSGSGYSSTAREGIYMGGPLGIRDSYRVGVTSEASDRLTIIGRKIWKNAPQGKLPNITLRLSREGWSDEVTLESGTLEHTWTDLLAYDEKGQFYQYRLEEVTPPEGYRSSVQGFTVTNEYIEKIKIKVTKNWIGGESITKPDVTFVLKQNNVEIKRLTLNDGDTSFVWTDLDKYDADGNLYQYTVEEVFTSDHFRQKDEIVKDCHGFTITNEYIVPKTSITVNKVWVGGPKAKPTITLELLRRVTDQILNSDFDVNKHSFVEGDGSQFEEVVSTIELVNGTTSHPWTDLPATDGAGHLYAYTVRERLLNNQDYQLSTELSGGNNIELTNTYQPKTQIKVTKNWIGGESITKPDVTFVLKQNNVEIKRMTLKDGDTSFVWTDLDKYDTDGNLYQYTVEEVFTSDHFRQKGEIVKDCHGFTITNEYIVPKTSITVDKVWVGGPKDKPTIQLVLMRDGQAYGKIVELKSGNTKYTWYDLDVTDKAGNVYTYSVWEAPVPGYTSTVGELVDQHVKVTNTYLPPEEPKIPKTQVKVEKVWDGGSEDRPTITIELLRNGQVIDTIQLTNGQRSHEWPNLEAKDSLGKEYHYMVRELAVDHYTSKVTGSMQAGYVITNTYLPPEEPKIPKTQVKVEKVWQGGSEARPTITIELLRNGQVIDTIQLTNGQLNHEWSDLEAKDSSGKDYHYTVRELAVDHYTSKVTGSMQAGYVITNTYLPPEEPKISKTQVKVEKVWEGGSEDRPTITIELLRNGQVIDTIQLTNGQLSHEWPDLEAKDSEGQAYLYTVRELAVDHYISQVTGSMQAGYVITNSYLPPEEPKIPNEPEEPDQPILKSSLPATGESDLTAIWLIAILLVFMGFCLIFDFSNVNSL